MLFVKCITSSNNILLIKSKIISVCPSFLTIQYVLATVDWQTLAKILLIIKNVGL